MAAICLKNAYISIGGSDLSSYVEEVTINEELDELEYKTMGMTARGRIAGLDDWSLEVKFRQDFAAGLLDAILAPFRGVEKAVIVKPNGGTTSTSNPKRTGNGIFFGWTPVAGAAGDLAEMSVTIKCSDGVAMARATTD